MSTSYLRVAYLDSLGRSLVPFLMLTLFPLCFTYLLACVSPPLGLILGGETLCPCSPLFAQCLAQCLEHYYTLNKQQSKERRLGQPVRGHREVDRIGSHMRRECHGKAVERALPRVSQFLGDLPTSVVPWLELPCCTRTFSSFQSARLRNDGTGEANLIDTLIPLQDPSEDLRVHALQLPPFKDGETMAQKSTAVVPEALGSRGNVHPHVSGHPGHCSSLCSWLPLLRPETQQASISRAAPQRK